MAWTTLRNAIDGTGGSYDERGRKKLIAVKDALVADGWTLRGSGNGVSSYSTTGVDHCTSWSACATGMWVWLENTDGAELVMWISDIQRMQMRASVVTGYSGGTGESATLPVGNTTPPADQITLPSTSYCYWVSSASHLSSMLVDGGTSFIVFGRVSSSQGAPAAAFVKLDGTQTGDTCPYWLYRFDSWATAGNWEDSYFFYSHGYQRSRHPVNGNQSYGAAGMLFPIDPLGVSYPMPIDPLSGLYPIHDVLVACFTSGSYHFKGKIPGIYRVSKSAAQGTKVYDNRFVVCDGVAFPWDSTDALSGT